MTAVPAAAVCADSRRRWTVKGDQIVLTRCSQSNCVQTDQMFENDACFSFSLMSYASLDSGDTIECSWPK